MCGPNQSHHQGGAEHSVLMAVPQEWPYYFLPNICWKHSPNFSSKTALWEFLDFFFPLEIYQMHFPYIESQKRPEGKLKSLEEKSNITEAKAKNQSGPWWQRLWVVPNFVTGLALRGLQKYCKVGWNASTVGRHWPCMWSTWVLSPAFPIVLITESSGWSKPEVNTGCALPHQRLQKEGHEWQVSKRHRISFF